MVWNTLIIMSAIPAVCSVLIFLRVPWWKSSIGRHLMAYMASIAFVLMSWVLHRIHPNVLVDNLLLASFFTVPVVMWWRFIILAREVFR